MTGPFHLRERGAVGTTGPFAPRRDQTPLITAASSGDADVARVLTEAGADIEAISAPDSGGVPGSTALGHAAVFGMTEVIDVLVAAGARIDSLEMAAAAGDAAPGRCAGSPSRAGSARWSSQPTTSG